VLFDLDGTLLDTLQDLASSMNAVLNREGFPPHPVDSYRYFVGDGVSALVQRSLPPPHDSDPALVSRCEERMRAEYAGQWSLTTKPYTGIPELLSAVAAKDLVMCVLSNKPHEVTQLMVTHYFGARAFAVAAGLRPGVPRKPDPAPVLDIATTVGIAPDGFVYLGDTGTDMIAATKAGMWPVGALWGFRTREELIENGALTLIDYPLDLLELLPSPPA
jgi:phosphoglycolate phosphatase